MERIHSYVSSIAFCESLDLTYLETYSFQRGANYQAELGKGFEALQHLKRRKDKKGNISTLEQTELDKLQKYYGSTQYLIDEGGVIHPTAVKTGTFHKDDPFVDRLLEILHTPIVEVPRWMCAPFYRDAIIFYDQANRIVSPLNVCLGCEEMEIGPFNHVDADTKTYVLMRRFFESIGHQVEDE